MHKTWNKVRQWLIILLPALAYLAAGILLRAVLHALFHSTGDEKNELICMTMLLPMCVAWYWHTVRFISAPNGILLAVVLLGAAVAALLFAMKPLQGISPETLLCVGLIGPINEELIYRGCVQQRAQKQYGKVIAYGLSAALFAVAHSQVQQMIPALLIGLLLAFVTDKTNQIAIPILLHMGWNFCILLLGRT